MVQSSRVSVVPYDGHLRARERYRPSEWGLRRLWERSLARWRLQSFRWRLDGGEIDPAEAWRTWVDEHEGDQERALGALLLLLDAAGALDR